MRITLKITEITRFEACFPLYIDARNSFCIGDEPKSGLARDLGDCLQSRNVPFGTSGDLVCDTGSEQGGDFSVMKRTKIHIAAELLGKP